MSVSDVQSKGLLDVTLIFSLNDHATMQVPVFNENDAISKGAAVNKVSGSPSSKFIFRSFSYISVDNCLRFWIEYLIMVNDSHRASSHKLPPCQMQARSIHHQSPSQLDCLLRRRMLLSGTTTGNLSCDISSPPRDDDRIKMKRDEN